MRTPFRLLFNITTLYYPLLPVVVIHFFIVVFQKNNFFYAPIIKFARMGFEGGLSRSQKIIAGSAGIRRQHDCQINVTAILVQQSIFFSQSEALSCCQGIYWLEKLRPTNALSTETDQPLDFVASAFVASASVAKGLCFQFLSHKRLC